MSRLVLWWRWRLRSFSVTRFLNFPIRFKINDLNAYRPFLAPGLQTAANYTGRRRVRFLEDVFTCALPGLGFGVLGMFVAGGAGAGRSTADHHRRCALQSRRLTIHRP